MDNKLVKSALTSRRSLQEKPRSRAGRQKTRGQAMVIIALAMFVLIGLVGLAIDGGSMYLQRRAAQNATDGGALAGTSTMLNLYQGMLYDNRGTLGNGTAGEEDAILDAITEYAIANGVVAGTLNAYFVNDNKQVISANEGYGPGGTVICGTSAGLAACKVGENGYVPWVAGVKGVTVSGKSETSSFFMSLFGWNTISAEASASAFMGPTFSTGPDVTLLPIGFFTSTERLRQMKVGHRYTLIAGNLKKVPTPLDPGMEWDVAGNWGYIDFNDNGGSTTVNKAWITCGYNPRALDDATWEAFCTDPKYSKVSNAFGPTKYWTGAGSTWDAGPFTAPRVEWKGVDGLGPDWWLKGSTGVSSSCQYFKQLVEDLGGALYYVPVFDKWSGSGSNTYFHLLAVIPFQFENDFNCQAPRQEWSIGGWLQTGYAAGASGSHGDLVHNGPATVFLEP